METRRPWGRPSRRPAASGPAGENRLAGILIFYYSIGMISIDLAL